VERLRGVAAHRRAPTCVEVPAARQHDSFYLSMTLIDVIAGY
jgi:hypothetical protein